MRESSLPLTRLVHENLSVVLAFAYSQGPLWRMIEENFQGEWKYLNKVVYEISRERAEKACIELAMFLRMIDDAEGITEYHRKTQIPDCGKLVMKDSKIEILTFREFANKTIHCSSMEWIFPVESGPTLILHGADDERWLRAEVNPVGLASVCGQFAS